MESQKVPILLNCLAAVLGAGGQYFYKRASSYSGSPFLNVSLIIGVLLFCGVMALFVLAYKAGGRISIVYPFYATTFVWGTLIGIFLEKESVRAGHFVGLAFLLAGLTVIALQVETK